MPIPPAAHLEGDPAIVARAEVLRPAIAAAGDEIETKRRLPPSLLDKLHDAQLFRLLLPRSQNGLETDPVTYLHVIETVARGDGSTGWCLSQAGGCAMAAAYLDANVAQKIFGNNPRAVLAWGPGQKVKAVECEGGYRVSGVWAFNSGGRHATWVGAHAPIFQTDGSPRCDSNGKQITRSMLVPAGDVEWIDVWDTVGLRGTASDQFVLNNHFVRADHSLIRDSEKERREPGPLYRMTTLTFYELGFAAVAMGIARACLDDFVDLAKNKIPKGATGLLRESAVVQMNLAQADVNLRSARAFLLLSVADIWKKILCGEKLSMDQRIHIRLISTNAIHKARDAVDFVYNAAGVTAIFKDQPFERRFRDIHTLTQQLQGRLSHFETVGAWMLGARADLNYV